MNPDQNATLYNETARAAWDAAAFAVQDNDYVTAIERLLNGRKATYSYSDFRKETDLRLAEVYILNAEILKAKGHFELAGEWERAKEMQQLWDALKAEAASQAH